MADAIHNLRLCLWHNRFENLCTGYVKYPVLLTPDDEGGNGQAFQQFLQGRNIHRPKYLFENLAIERPMLDSLDGGSGHANLLNIIA